MAGMRTIHKILDVIFSVAVVYVFGLLITLSFGWVWECSGIVRFAAMIGVLVIAVMIDD